MDLQKAIFKILSNCCFQRVTRIGVNNMTCRVLCPLEINSNSGLNSNGGLKREHLKFFLKTYLHYHNTYGHQTLKGGELPWGALTNKITWPFNHVALQDHVTNSIPYNSNTRVVMTTKLGTMVAHLNGLQWAATHKVTWLFDHAILQDHVTS